MNSYTVLHVNVRYPPRNQAQLEKGGLSNLTSVEGTFQTYVSLFLSHYDVRYYKLNIAYTYADGIMYFLACTIKIACIVFSDTYEYTYMN